MDVQEETMESKNISKGKRTKRQRTTISPFLLTMSTTTSCSSGEATVGGCGGGVFSDLTTSPSDSGEFTTQRSVELEQDMANCLILLAQGQSSSSKSAVHHELFQCKTCDRCFPSFQALGGHRTSHKKPKPVQEEKNSTTNNNALFLGHPESSTVRLIKDDGDTTLSLQIQSSRSDLCGLNHNNNNNKSRVHECSICGAEFSSGQALGGHMRRHRPLAAVASRGRNDEGSDQGGVMKTRTILSLDLNLPAPDQIEDDQLVESRNPFASKEQVIVFKASHPLVDCHY